MLVEGNNVFGLSFTANSQATICGGQLTVQDNAVFGLFADGAGVITLNPDASTGSSITGNGLDVNLLFGTRTAFQNVTIGSTNSDGTVLTSTNTSACP